MVNTTLFESIRGALLPTANATNAGAAGLHHLQPYATSQTVGREDALHVGGFSDAVFELLALWVGGGTAEHWIERIGSIEP